MMRVLCLIATEDRLWNMRRALRGLEVDRPVLVEGWPLY